MKTTLTAITFFTLLISSACASAQTPAAGPIVIQGDTAAPPSAMDTPVPTESTSSTLQVTKNDNGRTLNMKVGDSFLLNLGSDFYDWTVEVDNQSVLSREKNVTVIKGAQGIYQALAAGTATLTASGNPQCLNSNPPCMSPSISVTITVIVK